MIPQHRNTWLFQDSHSSLMSLEFAHHGDLSLGVVMNRREDENVVKGHDSKVSLSHHPFDRCSWWTRLVVISYDIPGKSPFSGCVQIVLVHTFVIGTFILGRWGRYFLLNVEVSLVNWLFGFADSFLLFTRMEISCKACLNSVNFEKQLKYYWHVVVLRWLTKYEVEFSTLQGRGSKKFSSLFCGYT